MSGSFLIGARGWEHPGWRARFYPEALPEDWRFCYYSQWLRAVLVPSEQWETVTESEVRAWAEDCDPQFRFVLELPKEVTAAASSAATLRARLGAFFKTIEPIRPLTAGLVIPAAPPLVSQVPLPPPARALALLIENLAPSALPLCVDLPANCRTPALIEIAAAHHVGLLWRCAEESAPPAAPGDGRLLVALARTADPKTQRQLLEALSSWQAGASATVGLFFDDPQAGAEQAKQARLLAEIMGLL
jgi:hypothetical protein